MLRKRGFSAAYSFYITIYFYMSSCVAFRRTFERNNVRRMSGNLYEFDNIETQFEHFVRSNGGVFNANMKNRNAASPFSFFRNAEFGGMFLQNDARDGEFSGHELRRPTPFVEHKTETLRDDILHSFRPSRIRNHLHGKQGIDSGGCHYHDGTHFPGEVWYSRACRRHQCIHFRGRYFIETDSCDSEIHNPSYKCMVLADTAAKYPHCCPRYECNPDNLGRLK